MELSDPDTMEFVEGVNKVSRRRVQLRTRARIVTAPLPQIAHAILQVNKDVLQRIVEQLVA